MADERVQQIADLLHEAGEIHHRVFRDTDGADVSRHVRRTVSGGLFAYVSDQNDCAVDYVHFTNGSAWTRPAR